MSAGKPMRQRGFTLIELIIVLVIAALLMLVAAPAFSTFMARQQLAGDVNQLLSVMTFARSEAIKQRQPITVRFLRPISSALRAALKSAVTASASMKTMMTHVSHTFPGATGPKDLKEVVRRASCE